MTLPSWLAGIATLDDDALAVLANRGLVRRAARLTEAIALIAAGRESVEVSCEQFRVRLFPAGPDATRCTCPVAGVCVHVVAGWLWTRTVDIAAPDLTSPVSLPEPRSPIPAPGMSANLSGALSPEAGSASVTTPAAELTRGQRQAAGDVAEVIERLVSSGISQSGRDAIDRLTRAGQAARLERLTLLVRVVDTATGRLRALVAREDDVTESACLSALAQAWALAGRLADDATPVPDALIGVGPNRPRAGSVSGGPGAWKGETADRGHRGGSEVGALIPLAVRWWTSASGARGLTFYAYDLDHGRLEEASTGRAAGVDPSFHPSWEEPMLWGASAARLSSGIVRLSGAERRADGTLSPTTRTKAEVTGWADLDLDALSAAVDGQSSGLARTGFGMSPHTVRLIRPQAQFGLGEIELDEVAQQLVWAFTDADDIPVRLALPATELNVRILTWLVEQSKLLAVTVVGDQPEAVFLPSGSGPVLVSLTLSPLPLRTIGPAWRRRILKLDRHRRAERPLRAPTDLERLSSACADVVAALAASGRLPASPRQAATLTQRASQADDLGLATLATAVRALTTPTATASDVLWARFVLDRVDILLI